MSNRIINILIVIIAIAIGVAYALWVDGGGPPLMMGR